MGPSVPVQGLAWRPGSHPTRGTSRNCAANHPCWTDLEPRTPVGYPCWAAPGLSRPSEGPCGVNAHRGVVESDLGPPAEGTRKGNTHPGGIELGGDNASDLGAGVGIRGVSWGGGTVLGGSQLTSLLQGERKMVGTTGPGGGPDGLGRGIPWLDRRGRVTAWLSPRLESVVPYEPHLLSPRESEYAPTDFRGGKDPG